MPDDDPFLDKPRFFAINGNRIAYDDSGSGPLVVALPGMGDVRAQYRFLRPMLREAGYRVVTIDVRGFGETSATWPDYSAHAVGRDTLALLDHLGERKAVVLGNSFAAGAALWAAHDDPARVRGVVLLGPIVRDLPMSFLTGALLRVGFAGPWRIWFWMTYWNSLFPSRKPADHRDYAAALRRNLREPGRMAALRTMMFLPKTDTAAMLDDSRVPALIVMGSRDPDFPDAAAEARSLAARIGAETLVVDGAGHYPHAEMPEAVAAPIAAFLRRSLPATDR